MKLKHGIDADDDNVSFSPGCIIKGGIIAAILVLVLGGIFGIVGIVFGWFGEAAQVAREEFGPRALLEKYEWFKDASAQLDAKQANLKVYISRVEQMREDYEGTARKDWDRTDKEQMNLWMSEYAGLAANYNSLAAEYNSQMAKFNWRFCNAGDLPEGATTPLPREYKPYETSIQ